MIKIASLVCCLLVFGKFHAQVDLYTNLVDTLKISNRLGDELDSIDLAFTIQSATFPGGGRGNIANTLPIDFFNQNYGGVEFRNFSSWHKMKFSSLPHLGFGYVFGSQGTQFVSANYQQAFGAKNLLNINYDAMKNNGFLRNSVTNQHDVQLQFQRISKIHSMKFKGNYLRKDIGQSGGLVSDSLIDDFGLVFLPVLKSDAQSRYRGARLQLENYLDLLTKDSLKATGIYVTNEMRIMNHRYVETGDLIQSYGQINYDSSSTADQDQLSELLNGAGIYLKTNRMFFRAGLLSNFWRYSNLGYLNEVTEIGVDGQIGINIKGVDLKNHTNFNIAGANQEWFSNSSLILPLGKFKVSGRANFSSLLPEQFQRSYFGNHVQSSISKLEKQFRSDILARAAYTFNQSTNVELNIQSVNLVNNYFFVNNSWRNDSIGNLNYISVGAKLETGYKILKVSFRGNFAAGKYVPKYLLQTRICLQGRLFKTRRLLAQIGVEGSVHDKYETLGYLPMLDAMQFGPSGAFTTPQMANLHVFGGFEIAQFRFFFRVENIGYVWNESRNELLVGYPIPAMNIRIGITWDFFN